MPNLSLYKHIVELSAGEDNDMSKINAYLDNHWTLLSTYIEGDVRTGQRMVYCLGWDFLQGEPVHPPDKYDGMFPNGIFGAAETKS